MGIKHKKPYEEPNLTQSDKQRVGGYRNPSCHYIPSFNVTYLLLYIDDIVIVGSNSEYVHRLKLHFSSIFDLGNLSYFLGLDI